MFNSFYRVYFICICTLYGFPDSVSSVTLNLSGDDWLLLENDGSANISGSVSAKVPGEVHMSLYKHGLLKDPLYRFNDLDNKWVATKNWTFTKKFNVSEDSLKIQQIDLVFEGLDTVAEIFLNGHNLGFVKNMFRKYIFSVKSLLKSAETNNLVIKFVSPVLYAKYQASIYPYRVPPECPPDVQHGECSYNFIRKAAYSFSWDWGPSYPSIGIWKDVYLKMYNYATLEYITSEAVNVNNIWNLQISSFLKVSDQSFGRSLKLIISMPELNVTHEDVVVLKEMQQQHDVNLHINSSDIKLWWPHGMGDQPLYVVHVRITQHCHYADDDECGASAFNDCESVENKFDSKTIHIGFRSVDLVQNYVEADGGLTFFFSVNNRPVFLKGSNWIPISNFLTNQSTDQIDWLFNSSIDVHMNVLRVWGGGVYESEEFYQKADKLGIMIWQDFMFACALYPTNDDFLDDIRHEVIHQVRRLKHHPSIIIWSGNNENEGVLANNWYGIAPSDFPLYKSDYVKLYVDVIRDVMLHEDMSRPYIPSSPTNGLQTMKEGWIARNPQDVKYGDIHFYDYKMDGWLPSLYWKPRMASEFGIQSWSSTESLHYVSMPSEDWKLMGEFAMHRQHHSNGETEIFNEINQHMQFNQTSNNDTEHFIHYVYLSQVNQAMSVKTQVEHYRRSGCNITIDEQLNVCVCKDEGTMGALYWQLNDIWQAPTWSSIEHNGRWKLLHYYAQHFFSNYLISPVVRKDEINKEDVVQFLSIVDNLNLREVQLKISNLSLILSCYKIDHFDASKTWVINFNQKSSHKMVHQVSVDTLLNQCQCKNREQCFVKAKLLTNYMAGILSENFLLLSTYIDHKLLPTAKISIENVKLLHEKAAEIVIETNHYAYFVMLEAIGFKGKFSDNGFIMTEKTKLLTFHSVNVIDINAFKNSIKVTSLSDVYI